MRSRKRSIRFTLFGLLAIPLVSLVTLWGFAAQGTASDAIQKRNLDTINRLYGDAATPMLIQVAQERLQSVTWLSSRGLAPRAPLDAQRRQTDVRVTQLMKASHSGSFRGTLTAPMKQRLGVLLDKIGQLGAIRRAIDSGAMDKLAAFNAYNDILDAHFQFTYLMVVVKDPTIYQQAYYLVGLSRAQELAGREATLVASDLIADGRMSSSEHAAFNKLVIEQRYLENEGLTQFIPQVGAPFRQLLDSTTYTDFKAMEDRVMASPAGKSKLRINPIAWGSASQAFIGGLDHAVGESRPILAGKSKALGDSILLRLALVGGVGLVAVVLSAFLMLRFGRRMSRELVGLQGAARDLADQRLPDIVSRLRRGDDVNVAEEAPPLDVGKTAEVSNVAEAFSTVQRTAIEAAVGQAELRKAVNQVFLNLARRNQALLHRQLAMLDTLERKASDPDALEDLFRLDHLTTRMRRHAEGLIILSGAAPGRGWRKPVVVTDVLRGAIGEIEDYARVEMISVAEEAIVGSAVADVIHLIAELVENAVSFSPPNTPVEVDAGLVGNGFVVEIQDRGLGMSEEKLAAINEQLAHPPEFDLADSDQLGLFVVGNLADRHGIKISLCPNAYGGLTTIVLIPHSIVVPAGEATRSDSVTAHDEDPAGDPGVASNGYDEVPMSTPLESDRSVEPVESLDDTQEHPTAGALRTAGRHRLSRMETFAAGAPVDAPAWPPGRPAEPPAPAMGRDEAAGRSGVPTAGTHAGMPRRVRQASLAPQLRGSSTPGGGQAATDCGTRSPERARSVMASMQSGWRRGRAEDASKRTPADTNPNQGE
jgi:signal transduction histidine kinase